MLRKLSHSAVTPSPAPSAASACARTVAVREHGANARRSTVAEEGFDLCDRAIDRRTGTLRRVREQLDHRRQDVAERGFAERARRGRIAALERGPGRVAVDARRIEVGPRDW